MWNCTCMSRRCGMMEVQTSANKTSGGGVEFCIQLLFVCGQWVCRWRIWELRPPPLIKLNFLTYFLLASLEHKVQSHHNTKRWRKNRQLHKVKARCPEVSTDKQIKIKKRSNDKVTENRQKDEKLKLDILWFLKTLTGYWRQHWQDSVFMNWYFLNLCVCVFAP